MVFDVSRVDKASYTSSSAMPIYTSGKVDVGVCKSSMGGS